MDLIVWRHAEAFDLREGQDDLERALTPKGERQAARMAQWLNQTLPATTRVLASPARRSQQTVAALERRVKTVPALAPDGTVEGLLAAARWPESREPVLVVGHQPTLGLAVAYLLAGSALVASEPWRIKKGGVWWLRHQQREGEAARLTVVTVRSPELL